jgi:hypothetical protein
VINLTMMRASGNLLNTISSKTNWRLNVLVYYHLNRFRPSVEKHKMIQRQMINTLANACQMTITLTNTIMSTFVENAVTQVKNGGDTILNLLFRCRHRTMSSPFTPMSKSGKPPAKTYVTCLDCGTHLHYDWTTMRMGKALPRPRYISSRTNTSAMPS